MTARDFSGGATGRVRLPCLPGFKPLTCMYRGDKGVNPHTKDVADSPVFLSPPKSHKAQLRYSGVVT
jgi:hypothetical protein